MSFRVQDDLGYALRSLLTPGLLALAGFLCAREFVQASYDVGRPQEAAADSADAQLAAHPAAYLGDDPFGCGRAKLLPPAALATELVVTELGSGVSPREDHALVLAVHVSGAATADAVEGRIRSRYAVVSALIAAGYYADPRLGLAPTSLSNNDPELDTLAPVRFAREWFACDRSPDGATSSRPRIVVLWLDEDAIGGSHRRFWGDLVEALEPDDDPEHRVRITILGPTGSDALVALVNERDEDLRRGGTHPLIWQGAPAADEQREETLILSPHATAKVECFDSTQDTWCELSPRHVGRLTRTIGEDPLQATILLEELEQRLPDLHRGALCPQGQRIRASSPLALVRDAALALGWMRSPTDTVRVGALVACDTEYGRRSLVALRDAEFARRSAARNAGRETPQIVFEPIPLVAGMDGRGSGRSQDLSDPDYPLGAKQLDYLRDRGAALAADGGYSAFVVIGSDLYDRLQILDALRPVLPEQLFVTVDLDARFAAAKHQRYTRNLVVVSHLGLEFDASLNAYFGLESRESRSFRDIYQHSLHLAALSAITGVEPAPPAIVVTETGAEGPVVLRRVNAKPSKRIDVRAAPVRAQALSAAPSVHWERWTASESLRVVLSLALLSVLALRSRSGRRPIELASAARSWLSGSRAVVMAGLLACALGAWLVTDVWTHRELALLEPVSLLQGVSAWPSIGLRASATVVALASIAFSWSRLSNAQARFERVVEVSPAVLDKTRRAAHAKTWRRLERSSVAPAGVRGSMLRLALGVVGVAVLLSPLNALSNPESPPIRGAYAFLLERTVHFVSLAALLTVTLYAIVAAQRARRFLAEFTPQHVADERPHHQHAPRDVDEQACERRFELARVVLREVRHAAYLPVAPLLLLVVSRLGHLDDWSWPAMVVATFAVAVAGILASTWILSRAAEQARAAATSHFERRTLECVLEPADRERAESKLRRIEEYSEGVFARWRDGALVRAVFVVLLALVALAAIDSLPAREMLAAGR